MADCTCIYSFTSDRHLADGSRAHIIPSAIGGRRTSTTIACGHHNNLTNTRLEKPFIEHFTFFNSMLSIVPGRGGTVPPLRGIRALSGKTYDLRPGGFPEDSRPTVIEHLDDDGTIRRIELGGYSERVLRRIMDSLKNKYPDLRLEAVRREWAQDEIVISKQMQLGPEMPRTAAKIGLEYLAACYSDRALLLGPSFDAARHFILDGTHEDVCLAFYDPRAEVAVCLGNVDHSVTVVCSRETGTACAFITVYGRLSLTVLLTRSWDGPTIGYEYVVDPLTGAQVEREAPEPHALSLEQVVDRYHADRDDWTGRMTMVEGTLNHILAVAERRRPDLARRDLVTKALEEGIWGEKGDLFTQEDLDRVVAYLADALADRILGRQ